MKEHAVQRISKQHIHAGLTDTSMYTCQNARAHALAVYLKEQF